MSYDKEKARLLKKQKKYEELFAYLSEFANSEISEALNDLAECYYWGLGTSADYAQSFYYDNAAASFGNADSIAALGFDYEHGMGVTADQNKAVVLYQQAVSLGSTRGMTYLGLCYENGTGVNKDYEMAVSLYQQAAEQGYARAQRSLGLCYEKGTGVTEDKCKAVYWYKKAAEQDNKIAQRWLAMCYEYGDGVDADISQAIEWYLKAIENDDDISRVNLACIYYDKFDDEEKDKIALDYLHTAIKNLKKDSYHYCLAHYKIAQYYEGGYLVECDDEKTFEYYKIAAEGGIEFAERPLARCYEEGKGTKPNNRKAIEWYKSSIENSTDNIDKSECYLKIGELLSECDSEEEKAESGHYYKFAYEIYSKEADSGNTDALIKLGHLFRKGKGVDKNYSLAFKCYEKADLKLCNSESKCWKAYCILYGFGVSESKREAFKILKTTLNDENPIKLSIILLIYCYMNGIGTKQSIKKAERIIDRFSLEDEEYISFFKGIIYYHGIGVKKDIEKARAFFKLSSAFGEFYLAVCAGDYSKADMLGLIYSSNSISSTFFLHKDDARAKEFFKLAYDNRVINLTSVSRLCELMCKEREKKQAFNILSKTVSSDINSPIVERLIGQYLFHGVGCKRDFSKALKYFMSSYEKGDDIAKVYLANCYATGNGVVKDLELAKTILEKSTEDDDVSKVFRGLLIYAGAWKYNKNKDLGLSLIKNTKGNRYKYFYDVLSTKRGDYYVGFFLDVFFDALHSDFDKTQIKRFFFKYFFRTSYLILTKNPHSENLSRKEMLKILLTQNQLLLEQNMNYAENQPEIMSTLNRIQTNTDAIPKIIEKQDEILGLMHSIIDYVSEQKQILPSENSLRYLDEQQLEQIQGKFIEETATKIVNSLQNNTFSVEREEAALKGLFGEQWSKLDQYTRKSLLSARAIFNHCQGSAFASLDHSGVVISATSALENELKRRLFSGYQIFMKNKFGDPNNDEWPELLVFRNKKGEVILNKSFTLGSLPYLFEGSDKDQNNLSEYLNTILSTNYANKGILAFITPQIGNETFIGRCEKIRLSYRNAAAHTGLVDRTKAEACCNAIIGPNDALEKLGQVQGLLYDLVQMTGNFK